MIQKYFWQILWPLILRPNNTLVLPPCEHFFLYNMGASVAKSSNALGCGSQCLSPPRLESHLGQCEKVCQFACRRSVVSYGHSGYLHHSWTGRLKISEIILTEAKTSFPSFLPLIIRCVGVLWTAGSTFDINSYYTSWDRNFSFWRLVAVVSLLGISILVPRSEVKVLMHTNWCLIFRELQPSWEIIIPTILFGAGCR